MKLKDISKEELELMGYDDIAEIILKEKNDKMKINDLFKEICDALNLGEREFEDRIADFFEILTTDKRFIMLENGYWDLKEKHSEKIVIDDDDEEIFIDEVEDEEPVEEEIFYDEEEDDSEDDLKDLVVIDDDEENENL